MMLNRGQLCEVMEMLAIGMVIIILQYITTLNQCIAYFEHI